MPIYVFGALARLLKLREAFSLIYRSVNECRSHPKTSNYIFCDCRRHFSNRGMQRRLSSSDEMRASFFLQLLTFMFSGDSCAKKVRSADVREWCLLATRIATIDMFFLSNCSNESSDAAFRCKNENSVLNNLKRATRLSSFSAALLWMLVQHSNISVISCSTYWRSRHLFGPWI